MEDKKIYLAILNITSWVGYSGDAEHVYGTLYLSENSKVGIDNVEDFNVKYLGEKSFEIKQVLTLEMAKYLDEKENGKSYQRAYRIFTSDRELDDEEKEYYGYVNRFNTFDEVVKAGVAKWKELDIDCPFISLYEGEKYSANSYEPSSTVILNYGETL